MAPLSQVWDPEFSDSGPELGGFSLSLSATRFDQHRSLEGPTFRLACGESFEGRLLLEVPGPAGVGYDAALIAFIDYEQTPFHVEGVLATVHRLRLKRGAEHVLAVRLPPLQDGIHRLALLVLDADQQPGLFGAYDYTADLYVGPTPKLAEPGPVQQLPTREDGAVREASYGILLTTTPERLLTFPVVEWRPDLIVWVSFWGSVRYGERPVVITGLQDFRQVDLFGVDGFVLAGPGSVATVPFSPKRPAGTESLRAIVFTGVDREMVPREGAEDQYGFRAKVSQKAFVRLGGQDAGEP